MAPRLTEVLAGVAAGLGGTVLMTAVMRPAAARFLPRAMQPEEFQPRKVVRWGERVLGQPAQLSARQEQLTAAAAHLGYGGVMGGLYALLRSRFRTMPAPLAGTLFGFDLWVFGYEGWMRALGVQAATTAKPMAKWPVPLGSHLVYGLATAVLYKQLRERRS